MMLTEFDEQKFKEQTFEEGMDKGTDSTCRRHATIMLTTSNLPFSTIAKFSELSEDAVRELASSLNIVTR